MSPELKFPGTNACLVPTKQDSPNEAARRMVTIKMNSFQIDIVRLFKSKTSFDAIAIAVRITKQVHRDVLNVALGTIRRKCHR